MSQLQQYKVQQEHTRDMGGGSQGHQRQGLPVPIHPDDAKDKVFTAILKALLKMENKPSSPKELANVIIKYKYATLGGATPFATVSSRISQHFKRAAEHNPPRPPLLAKHVDQHHSRKINYSLATDQSCNDPSLTSAAVESAETSHSAQTLSNSSDDEATPRQMHQRLSKQRSRRTKRIRHKLGSADHRADDADDESDAFAPSVKRLRHTPEGETTFTASTDVVLTKEEQLPFSPPLTQLGAPHSDDESEAEYSDYHEEMMKSDEHMASIEIAPSRRSSVTRRPSIQHGDMPRKSSLSLASTSAAGLLAEQDFWTPYSFEQDFSSVFLSDNATANGIPLNIVTPESMPVSELDTYFGSNNGKHALSTSPSAFPMNGGRRMSRKSISASAKESSLLQRVLLASAARGAAGSDESLVDPDWTNEDESHLPRRPSLQDTADAPASPATSLTDSDTSKASTEEEKPRRTKAPSVAHPAYPYTITRKTVGNMECYELVSPKDIPDTNVLRFIASTDGTSEHVALRTRHADKDKKVHEHAYLVEGYINATQLRKAARPVLGKGSFDATAEAKEGRVVVMISKGPMECRGAWIPLARARELLEEFEIESSPALGKLLSDDPLDKGDSFEKSGESTAEEKEQELEEEEEDDDDEEEEEVEDEEDVDEDEEDEDENGNEEEASEKDHAEKATVEEQESMLVDGQVDSDSMSSVPSIQSPKNSKEEVAAERYAFDTHNDDVFVEFGEDDKKPIDSPASDSQSTWSSTPFLSQTTPNTMDFIPSISKSIPGQPATTGPPPSSSSSSSPTPAFDLKDALAHIPGLGPLLKKEPLPTPIVSPVSPASASLPTDSEEALVVRTKVPTNPPMYITLVDNVAVCVAVFEKSEGSGFNIMRRLDTGYINGTMLLTAGGIETESERSMILSFEMDRKRVPKKKSALFGTWIPLRRAQQLAVTCSIQHRLGPFLDDNIEPFFPSPLPISIPVKRSLPKDNPLSSWALTALRNMADPTPPHTGALDSYPTAAQLQELMLNRSNRVKAGKAPLLGCFEDEDDWGLRRREVVMSTPASRRPSQELNMEPAESAMKHSESDGEVVVNFSDDDTDTDTDVEEVRQRMKKMRDAAIDAMENGSLDLEDLLTHANSNSSVTRAPFRSAPTSPTPTPTTITSSSTSARRRNRVLSKSLKVQITPRRRSNGSSHNHSNHAHSKAAQNGGGKIMPSILKKSASWNGALSLLRNSKRSASKKRRTKDDKVVHRVVKHSPPATTLVGSVVVSTPTTPSMEGTTIKASTSVEDDEDEEIDIGGSDRDDDLR